MRRPERMKSRLWVRIASSAPPSERLIERKFTTCREHAGSDAYPGIFREGNICKHYGKTCATARECFERLNPSTTIIGNERKAMYRRDFVISTFACAIGLSTVSRVLGQKKTIEPDLA